MKNEIWNSKNNNSSFWLFFSSNLKENKKMNKLFLLNSGYRLTGKEYSGLVKKFSTTIPYSLLGTDTIQNRFLSLIDDSYRKQSDS